MPFYEYWIGKGIDVDALWEDFDSGQGYIEKFRSIEPYLLRLTFDGHPKHLPLFDHEALYRTIKGAFHDVKAVCLTPQDYEAACPVFLYRVDRSSGIYEFLGQLAPVLAFASALVSGIFTYQKLTKQSVEIDQQKLTFIRSQFPSATDADIAAFMKAWTSWGRAKVIQRLIKQGLHRVEVSRVPFKGDVEAAASGIVDITQIIDRTEGKPTV